jgi:diguanylate cyclase (GGDEF)-like protein
MSSKEELYKLLLEVSPYGTLFFAYGVCVDCNPRAQDILGCDKRTLLGTSLDDTPPEEPVSLHAFKDCLKTALAEDRDRITWRLRNGSGEEVVDLHLRKVGRDQADLVVTLMEQSSRQPEEPGETPADAPDTALRAEQAAPDGDSIIEKLSQGRSSPRPVTRPLNDERAVYYDGLTRLPNRLLLTETIGEHLKERAGREVCAALLMVDIDHFKDINDSWGHQVGDQVIRKLATVIGRLVGEGSLAARLAGDEFLLFVPDIADNPDEAATNARALAEQVKDLISHPVFHEGHEFILTASVGIALITDTDVSAERALQYADTAMYEAKRKGRNGIAFFDPGIAQKAQRQVGLNTKLRKAVDNQEFALYVQPKICINTGRLMGGEALLRWVNSDRITNMPSEFIPLLESSGLIVNVGHWVIRTACEYIRNFLDAGLWADHMRMGINISPRQFKDPQLLEVIEHSLKSYEIDPHYLDFEVTENLVIEDVEDAIRKMKTIKNLGAMFSIDDFGIGYSSMIYLKRLPFDQLKIDREFIRHLHSDSDSRGVVEAIIAVSRQYGLNVTAEGVEDDKSLDVLRLVGCDHYQGAYYSMPVPVDRFRRMLAA